MKNIKKDLLVWVQLITFVILWILVLLLSGTDLKIDWSAIKKLPDVVTAYIILAFLFTKWAWKWRIFRDWLVPFPNLQGTWKGTLHSTWVDPNTGQRIPPREIVLVIKQTFSTLSCVTFTNESDTYSTTAQINQDDESGVFRLSYNYTNRPRSVVRDRSEIHDGAAILKIILDPKMKLEGEYWTSRKTTGDISVKYISRKLAQSFS